MPGWFLWFRVSFVAQVVARAQFADGVKSQHARDAILGPDVDQDHFSLLDDLFIFDVNRSDISEFRNTLQLDSSLNL